MTSTTSQPFRPEIQGLRAVAVSSVLFYHVWPALLPGGFVGVDVFFVISGYLITEVLLRDVKASGRIGIVRFYGRRIKRLLPAATLVLVVTAACYPLLPVVSWEEHSEQILASTLYYQNWWLGLQAIDYLASERAPGVLQHFWSLSVEEQYYLVWPLLFLIIRRLFAPSRLEPLTTLKWFISGIFAASLIHSIHLSYTQPELAYFASSTRAWELALGGILAAYGGNNPTAKKYKRILSAVGMVLVASAFFLIGEDSIFPGWIALIPTLGTVCVIYAGNTASNLSPQAILRSKPFQYLGDISYSLYLWHWPVIIFFQYQSGRPPTLLDGLAIFAISCALAHLSKTHVEDTLRQRDFFGLNRGWPFLLGAACITIAAAGALLVDRAHHAAMRPDGQRSEAAHVKSPVNGSSDYQPTALTAREDRPLAAQMGCHTNQAERQPRVCSFGTQQSPVHLVLIGDSHAAQWSPAFREIVEANGWYLTVLTKSACAFAKIPVKIGRPPRSYEECIDWSLAVVDLLQELKPTHVIIGQSMAQRVYEEEDVHRSAIRLANAYQSIWQLVGSMNSSIIALRDTPRMAIDVPVCLTTPGKTAEDCSALRNVALDHPDRVDPILLATQASPHVHLLDFSNQICNATVCPAVTDGTLVWRDGHHLTATFVKKLIPALAAALEPILSLPVSVPSFEPSPNAASDAPEPLRKEIADALADSPDIYRDRCLFTKASSEPKVCEYGDSDGELHVLLAGDTRAGQWLPALQEIATSKSLRISTAITYACALGNTPYQDWDCAHWSEQMIATIQNLRPDLVIYSQSRGYRVNESSRGRPNALALARQFIETISRSRENNVRWIVIPDTPRMTRNVSECMMTQRHNAQMLCSVTKAAALPNADYPDPLLLAAKQRPTLEVLDLSAHICPTGGNVCPPLIDGNLVWRSKYLVTASFAATQFKVFAQTLFNNEAGQ